MYKKILLFIYVCICLFCLTGCDATYNLTIDGNSYQESTAIVENNSAYWESGDYPSKSLLEYGLEHPFALDSETPIFSETNDKISGLDYYNVENLSDNNSVGIRFDGTFDSDSFERSNMVVSNYNRFVKATIDGNVVLSTGERLKSFDQYINLNRVIINIKTNNKVVKHNADEVNGNTYTWTIDRNNYIDKSVYFEFEQPKESGGDGASSFIFNPIILIIILVIIIVACIIALFIFIKNRKNNRL